MRGRKSEIKAKDNEQLFEADEIITNQNDITELEGRRNLEPWANDREILDNPSDMT